MKVRLNKNHLDYFRRQARNNPKEIYACLLGTIDSVDKVTVKKFAYPYLNISTSTCVEPNEDSLKEIAQCAEEKGLRIIGTIHSHPDWFPVLSAHDHRGHILDAHRISGVCGVLHGRTKVVFWIAESSLPCKIEYI